MRARIPLAMTLSILGAIAMVGLLRDLEPDRGDDVLKGLWTRYDDDSAGAPLRFYYFHGDGNGLYRYGRVGHTNTHSFRYRVDGEVIDLTFKKSGERHEMPFRLRSDEQGARFLTLEHDPREPGPTEYRLKPLVLDAPGEVGDFETAGALPGGRMWIDVARFATGGMGFSIYQLAPPALDGRGVGWHHRGDFDDWSTEAFSYRLAADQLELAFSLSGERFVTPFAIATEDGERALRLEHDPRNFWHRSRFVDMGRSFDAKALAPGALGFVP